MSRVYKEAYSLEAWGGATFDVMLRFLYEDPGCADDIHAHRDRYESLSRTSGPFHSSWYAFHFVSQAKQTGIDIFRVFDSLNDLGNLEMGIEAVHAARGLIEGAIMYTGDMLAPDTKYSFEYYMKIVDWLIEYDTHIISIKSMSGVMKPAVGRMLVKRSAPNTRTCPFICTLMIRMAPALQPCSHVWKRGPISATRPLTASLAHRPSQQPAPWLPRCKTRHSSPPWSWTTLR